MRDTIAAIATPEGTGGMAVIRISGDGALSCADKVFVPFHGRRPSEMDGYTCAYGYIRDGEERIDDCVLTVFRSPHSYTGEDTAEISCHGGRYVTRRILRTVLAAGASPAGPGAFTRQSFLNGKMTLTQAEAVADVISASGEDALRCARALREGATYRRIVSVRSRILDLTASLGVWADYPDEDIEAVETDSLLAALQSVYADMQALLDSYDYGRILREGIRTAIVGRPNVGKSTLFNVLAGCERSIVTDIAGTTRDVVEEQICLGGLTLRLSDTAGVRETTEQIEQMGVERSLAHIREAELILAVFDVSTPFSPEDEKLLNLLPFERTIAVCNKLDAGKLWEPGDCPFAQIVEISAKTGDGTDALHAAVARFAGERRDPSQGMIANERQRNSLCEAISAVQEAAAALKSGYALDAVTVSLEGALDALLELTGERVSDAVVDRIFARFCVGK